MKREDIKQLLSSKSIKEVASETGYSRSLVYAWLNGTRDNLEIEASVLEKVAEMLEKKKELTERIKNAL